MAAVVAFLAVVIKAVSSSGTAERVEYLSQRADGERTVALSASVTVTLHVRVGLPASTTPDESISTSKGSGSERVTNTLRPPLIAAIILATLARIYVRANIILYCACARIPRNFRAVVARVESRVYLHCSFTKNKALQSFVLLLSFSLITREG